MSQIRATMKATLVEVQTRLKDRNGNNLQYPSVQLIVEDGTGDRKYIDIREGEKDKFLKLVGQPVEIPVSVSSWAKSPEKHGLNLRMVPAFSAAAV